MYKCFWILISSSLLFFSFIVNSHADGGIIIQGTRVIYPQSEDQLTLSISNTSEKDSFLVQSWVENQQGSRIKDIMVVPPLYLSSPKDENLLRLMLINKKLPRDRETLYYFIAKGIPPLKKDKNSENVVRIALASRIKLFVRPSDLHPSSEVAPDKLRFNKIQGGIVIENPTPYYITLVDIEYGSSKLESIMLSPFSKKTIVCHAENSSRLSYSTINDYGATTKPKVLFIR